MIVQFPAKARSKSNCQPPQIKSRSPERRQSKPDIDMALIGPDTPLRLETAVQLAFPDGGMTVAGLRSEAKKDHLVIETIANKQFTTLNNIREMRNKCRGNQKAQGSGLNQSERKTAGSASGRSGLSVTERARSARAALEETARALSERSENTSPQNTNPQNGATATPLKP
jgi:hypothetical protein